MKKGFTLIEVTVVIAVIGILASVIAPNAFRAIEKAKVTGFVEDYRTVKAASYSLYADTGRWPAHYENLQNPLVTGAGGWSAVTGWNGPYMERLPQARWIPSTWWQLAWQDSCADRSKDWDGDVGCEYFFCVQPAPPVSAQTAIDRVVDGGDGYNRGSIRGRVNGAWQSGGCLWPLFADN